MLALERAGRRGIADEKHRARVQPRTGLGTRMVLGRGVPVAMQPRALPVIRPNDFYFQTGVLLHCLLQFFRNKTTTYLLCGGDATF